jgi:hypothetical protein
MKGLFKESDVKDSIDNLPPVLGKTFASSEKTIQTGAESPKAQVAGTSTSTQIQATNTTVTEPGPTSLWDRAYDALKLEQPDVWSTYENVLSQVLVEGKHLAIGILVPQ